MIMKEADSTSNIITLEGVTFKTSGNIIFQDAEEASYFLAQSSVLEKMEGVLEHGLQILLRKAKT